MSDARAWRRLLFLLPLLTLALMAGFFAWSLLAGRDPASIGSVLVGRPAPRLDLPRAARRRAAAHRRAAEDRQAGAGQFLRQLVRALPRRASAVHAARRARGRRHHRHRLEEQARGGARLARQALGDPFASAGLDLDGKTGLDWGLIGVPETYLIDGKGIVRLHFRGPITDARRSAANEDHACLPLIAARDARR